MVHFTMVMADMVVLATHSDGQWLIKGQDSMTARLVETTFTRDEFAAVMALFCEAGEHDMKGYDVPHLYSIAEPACERLGLRLIP